LGVNNGCTPTKAYGIWIWKEVENKAANLESKKRYFSSVKEGVTMIITFRGEAHFFQF
jgi:hypothetical protein